MRLGSRYLVGNVMVMGALVVTIASIVFPIMKGFQFVAASAGARAVSTSFGPLTQADRDFVVRVRLAGLWEYPAGRLALEKGTTPAVRTAGRHLVDGHAALDASGRAVATQLGIALPNQATQQQQGFVAILSATTGEDFDRRLTDTLWVAQGQIVTGVASIRATTRNTLVRQLADQANAVVLDHMKVLEETGFLDLGRSVSEITAVPTADPAATAVPSPSPGEPLVSLTSSPGASVPGDSIGSSTASPSP